jgi:uncharacterized membrane protein
MTLPKSRIERYLSPNQDLPMRNPNKPKRSEQNSVVAIFGSHNQAEEAVRELQQNGFNMKKLSIVGKDYHTDEHVVGYYNTGDRMMYWGKMGAFWGGLWGMLFGSAFFFVPGVGPLLVAGPLVTWIVGALEGAAVMGGLSALGAALVSIGIPKDSVLQYEANVKAGKFLLILHGTPQEVERAKDRLDNTEATETAVHAELVAVGV